jgi:hypothetical protein
MARKAAVIIGVDKTGSLPPLKSAAAGALEVAAWLKEEGFDVRCLTDQDKDNPVKSGDVADAIADFVTNPPRYALLVVYFSGHGVWHTKTDHWLLSKAPVTTTEAINLKSAMDLAGSSGIPNVVFVSDACRSMSDSRVGDKVDGIAAFPNYAEITTYSKVDVFKATGQALPAYEIPIAGVTQSVLTCALKAAFEAPEPYMVREVAEGTETIQVVPNRQLEGFLQRKVNALLAQVDPFLTQPIEANVPSSDDVYIARVRPKAPSALQPPQPPPESGPPTLSPGADAAETVARHLSIRGFAVGAIGASLIPTELGTEREVRLRLPDPRRDRFETHTGFVIQGRALADALYTGRAGAVARVLERGRDASGFSVVRVESKQQPQAPLPRTALGSLVLVLEDERCAILPCLPGYIGHATLNETGLLNVSYVPSTNDLRWSTYAANQNFIDRLRALVSVAIDQNAFQIRSAREGAALAEQIRTMKAQDPTLGLYAAIAYAQAGDFAEVGSVLSAMRQDLQGDLFDVRMLGIPRGAKFLDGTTVVPFCPILTQSWNLLSPRRIDLPQVLHEASAYLCDSLWTTFEPKGARLVVEAIHSGDIR